MSVNSVSSAATASLSLRDRLSQVLSTRPAEAREERSQQDAARQEHHLRREERRSDEVAQAGYGARVDMYI